MTTEPPLDQRSLVSPVVVEDQMNVKLCRDSVVDAVEELAKLDRSVTLATLADHAASLHVEGSKQSRRAVTHVVVRSPRDCPAEGRGSRDREPAQCARRDRPGRPGSTKPRFCHNVSGIAGAGPRSLSDVGGFGCNGGRAVRISPISPCLLPIGASRSSKSVLALPPFRFRTPKSDRLLEGDAAGGAENGRCRRRPGGCARANLRGCR